MASERGAAPPWIWHVRNMLRFYGYDPLVRWWAAGELRALDRAEALAAKRESRA